MWTARPRVHRAVSPYYSGYETAIYRPTATYDAVQAVYPHQYYSMGGYGFTEEAYPETPADSVESATRKHASAQAEMEKAKETYEEAKKKLEECEKKLKEADDILSRAKKFWRGYL